MILRSRPTLVALAMTGALALTACSSDDGAGVTDLGAESGDAGSGSGSGSGSDTGSGSGSGSDTGSGSGSGSGLGSDLQSESDNELVTSAVADYQVYVVDQVAQTQADTTVFTDAVRAGDLEAAREAYAPSREGWERIEPIAGLIPELDGTLDSRVDDFAGPEDPEFTGWHRLEYLLFEQETTEGGAEFADQLDADLATLAEEVETLDIPAAAVPVGASELIEEVSLGKITGEENRYAKTDLWDLGANVEGAEYAIELLSPALQEADPDLAAELDSAFADLESTLEPLREGEGWVLYCLENDEFPSERCPDVTVDPSVVDQLTAQTAALSELTSQAAGALGLEQ
ncbi:MAG: EfeM/EfeO family lipoprotein [Ornithinimicrobium sp.]